MSYERNYGGTEDPDVVEMVEIAPHSFMRRDVAEALGLKIADSRDG